MAILGTNEVPQLQYKDILGKLQAGQAFQSAPLFFHASLYAPNPLSG
jgi:hypothetical protein